MPNNYYHPHALTIVTFIVGLALAGLVGLALLALIIVLT